MLIIHSHLTSDKMHIPLMGNTELLMSTHKQVIDPECIEGRRQIFPIVHI